MKNLLYQFILITILTGCDYFESSHYQIINESSKEILIRTNKDPYDHGVRFNDSVHSVPPSGLIEFYQDRGLTGKNVIPPDYFEPFDTIPPVTKFDIFIDNELFDTLRMRQLWEFSARETVGTYTLTLTDELLEHL
jgi:hypothetical protein